MTTEEILFIIDENQQLLFNGTEFHPLEDKKTKNYFSASTITQSELKIHGFKISQSASDEKIEIQSEMKMFEEANLNPEIDYKIAALKIPLEDDDDNYIESYAVEISSLEQQFSSIAKNNKQIDAIFPPSLSYSALYSFELLEKKNDLFIHFGDDESYAVIFKSGQYISTRILPSINEIANKVGVDITKMKEILSTKGVDNSLFTPEEFLHMGNTEDELSKIVERISHTIGHKRGIFKLNSIDRIYLDFEGSDIPAFLNLFDNFGYESATKQTLDIFENVEVGMKHYALNALYALAKIQEKDTLLNLSIFERKPSFIQSHVGQFSIVMLVATLLAAIYPVYAMLDVEKLSNQENKLNNDVKKMNKVTLKLQVKLKNLRKEREELKKNLSDSLLKINTYSHTADALLDFDKEALSRHKMMKDINLAMRKFSLSSQSMEFDESKTIMVQIISNYNKRDNISQFIKELLSKGYSHVRTKKVQKTENYYESFVEIHR